MWCGVVWCGVVWCGVVWGDGGAMSTILTDVSDNKEQYTPGKMLRTHRELTMARCLKPE